MDSDTSKLLLDPSDDVGKIYQLVLTTIYQPFMYQHHLRGANMTLRGG